VERKLSWTGVLIEAEPNNFALALEKKRNVNLVPACLSVVTKPKLTSFALDESFFLTKMDAIDRTVKVQCLPLYSILLAVNQTTVDLLSLDVMGDELSVLKTIPFDKVDLKVLSHPNFNINTNYTYFLQVLIVKFLHVEGGKQTIKAFMTDKGYVAFPSLSKERTSQKWAQEEYIFVKKGCGYKET
jgi:hypothetical protein